jgi:hypothetical protein
LRDEVDRSASIRGARGKESNTVIWYMQALRIYRGAGTSPAYPGSSTKDNPWIVLVKIKCPYPFCRFRTIPVLISVNRETVVVTGKRYHIAATFNY